MRKKLFFISLVTFLALIASCDKDNKPEQGEIAQYGIDGKTPLPDAVDIGTVVNGKKILWASFNLGAKEEYEYGDYYAWGESETKSDYSWGTYKYANKDINKLTKYCPTNNQDCWDGTTEKPDGNVALYPTDDVVHVRLGGKWRMPTSEEMKALLALKTSKDHIWEGRSFFLDANGDERKDDQGNIIHCIRITHKVTGATLFIPAAGYHRDSSTYEAPGYRGFLWTSIVDTDNPNNACILKFEGEDSEHSVARRYLGIPVRPVSEE